MHQLTFGLIYLKSIEHDYVKIIKVSVFQAINTVREAWDCKHYNPRIEGSIPVRGNFFTEIILI